MMSRRSGSTGEPSGGAGDARVAVGSFFPPGVTQNRMSADSGRRRERDIARVGRR